MKKNKSSYQERMQGFVAICWIYGIAASVAIVTDKATTEGMILFSTFCVLAALAKGFDAVRDSLLERINLQSSWQEYRFTVLENATNSKSGSKVWREHGMPNEGKNISSYWDVYPEKLQDHDFSKWGKGTELEKP